jgi:hypothetical protein
MFRSLIDLLTNVNPEGKGRRIWCFRPGDRVTWNEKTGVDPGYSHLDYERELGKELIVEEASFEVPKEVLDRYSGSFFDSSCDQYQYVRIRGRWFTAEWFKPHGYTYPPKYQTLPWITEVLSSVFPSVNTRRKWAFRK